MIRLAGFLSVATRLAGCQSLGRFPGRSDAGCIHEQMMPPGDLVFDMAVGRCIAPVSGQPLTGYGAHRPVLDLHGTPDPQANARAAGLAYTD